MQLGAIWPVAEGNGTVRVDLRYRVDQIGHALDPVQDESEEVKLVLSRQTAGIENDQPWVQAFLSIKTQKITAVVGDQNEAFIPDDRQQVRVLSTTQAPPNDMRGMVSTCLGERDQIGCQALVDQERVVHRGRPAFSHSTQALIPSSGKDG